MKPITSLLSINFLAKLGGSIYDSDAGNSANGKIQTPSSDTILISMKAYQNKVNI